MLKKPAGERLKLLREAEGAEASFLWAILRDQFHYAAVHLESIAENARDMDFAMRWGFGMPSRARSSSGRKPAGCRWRRWIKEDIDAGKALCKSAAARLGVQGPGRRGGRRAHRRRLVERIGPQIHPAPQPAGVRAPAFPRERARLQALARVQTAGTTVHEDDAIRLWTLDDADVLIASIKTKMHAISPDVAEGLAMGVDLAEKSYKGW